MGLPTYVVTGRVRSGTSMMMRALVVGGMKAIYEPSMNGRKTGTKEPYDVYELQAGMHWDSLDDPPYKGPFELSKIFCHMLQPAVGYTFPQDDPEGRHFYQMVAPVGNYRMIFMSRPDDVIMASMVELGWPAVELWIPPLQDSIDALMSRPDFDVTVVDYEEVCKYPSGAMNYLRKRGWPIDPGRAATIPNTLGEIR